MSPQPDASVTRAIPDESVLASLRGRVGPAAGWIGAHSFQISDVRPAPGAADLRLVDVAPGESDADPGWLRLALPSSGLPQPGLCAPPNDADDWVEQLRIWVMEEVDTGGLTSSRVREEIDGRSFVVVEGYGSRLSDPDEHERPNRLVGTHGWHTERPPGRLARAWARLTSCRSDPEPETREMPRTHR